MGVAFRYTLAYAAVCRDAQRLWMGYTVFCRILLFVGM